MYKSTKDSYGDTKLKGFIYTVIGTVAWGFSGIFGEYLMKDLSLDAKWLTAFRMICAGLILIIISLIFDKNESVKIFKNKKDLVELVLFSLFGLVFCQYTFLMAILHSNAGTATVLQYIGPIFIILYVCARALRLPTRIETLSIVFAFMGVFLLSTNGNVHTLVISKEGLLWGLLSALGAMLYILIPGNLLKKYSSLVLTGYGMLFGGTILYIIIGGWNYSLDINLQVVLGLSAIILIGTVLAYTLYLQGVKFLGPVRAGLLAAIEPVSAVIFSIILLGTDFSFIDLIGILIILFSVYLLTKSN